MMLSNLIGSAKIDQVSVLLPCLSMLFTETELGKFYKGGSVWFWQAALTRSPPNERPWRIFCSVPSQPPSKDKPV